MALKRTQYWQVVSDTLRDGETGHGESLQDMDAYLRPVDQARSAASWGAGVADGLRVSATAGSPGLRVGLGAAQDAAGRLILLESGGVAVTDPAADPTAVLDVPTAPVGADGIAVDTVGGMAAVRTGAVELRVPQAAPTVGEQPAAALRARPDGGLDIDVAGGANAALSVRDGGDVVVAGRIGIEELLADAPVAVAPEPVAPGTPLSVP